MAQVLPFASLSAVSAVGAGSSADLNGVSDEFTMYVTSTGSPTYLVHLEGSHDGVNWFTVATSSSANPVSTVVSGGQQAGSSPVASYMHLARYVRANLISLSGGSSPTITATIAVGEVH